MLTKHSELMKSSNVKLAVQASARKSVMSNFLQNTWLLLLPSYNKIRKRHDEAHVASQLVDNLVLPCDTKEYARGPKLANMV